MMKPTCLLLFLLLAGLSAGCVTYEVDAHGNPIEKKDGLAKELVFDSNGRFLGVATRLSPPHTIIINGGKPTEREIRLLGVEGKSAAEAPNTYRRCQEWMAEFLSHGETLYIRPQPGTDTGQYVIYGEVYLDAAGPDGKPVDGYVMVNMAMLSMGLVKLRDAREFTSPALQERMREVEDKARREKLGLWSPSP